MAISEVEDGRVLVHCFAGCDTEDVLDSVGMTFSDLMPERIGTEHAYKPIRHGFDARQVMEALSHEIMVIALIAEDFVEFVPDSDRFELAVSRVFAAISSIPSSKTSPELKSIRRAA